MTDGAPRSDNEYGCLTCDGRGAFIEDSDSEHGAHRQVGARHPRGHPAL